MRGGPAASRTTRHPELFPPTAQGTFQLGKRPVLDLSECSLCEGCIAVCPDVFQINETTGLLEIIDMDDFPEACVDEAIKYCPEDCITWEEE